MHKLWRDFVGYMEDIHMWKWVVILALEVHDCIDQSYMLLWTFSPHNLVSIRVVISTHVHFYILAAALPVNRCLSTLLPMKSILLLTLLLRTPPLPLLLLLF